ncbi:MAG: AraC family transcriptional regulator [Acidobacteriota bacterium]
MSNRPGDPHAKSPTTGREPQGASEGIPAYETLAEFYSSLGGESLAVVSEESEELTVHRLEKLHGEVPFASPIFRANYYTIVLVISGRGRYFIDRHRFDTSPGTVYFTNPGHLKGFEILEPSRGFVITFSEPFLHQWLRGSSFDDFAFLLTEVVPPCRPPVQDFASLERLAETLHLELHLERAAGSGAPGGVLGSLLVALLLRVKEAFEASGELPNEDGAKSPLVVAFRQALEGAIRAMTAGESEGPPQVQQLAEALHLHPSYLSTVVKGKTGRSVQEWIALKMVAEAQALLRRSRLPIKAVAFRLGFSEPGHFSRFFKRHTGQTPTAYRRGREGAGEEEGAG